MGPSVLVDALQLVKPHGTKQTARCDMHQFFFLAFAELHRAFAQFLHTYQKEHDFDIGRIHLEPAGRIGLQHDPSFVYLRSIHVANIRYSDGCRNWYGKSGGAFFSQLARAYKKCRKVELGVPIIELHCLYLANETKRSRAVQRFHQPVDTSPPFGGHIQLSSSQLIQQLPAACFDHGIHGVKHRIVMIRIGHFIIAQKQANFGSVFIGLGHR